MRIFLVCLAGVVLAASALWLAGSLWSRTKSEVDQCLELGGCWDAEKKACEMHDQSRCKPLPD